MKSERKWSPLDGIWSHNPVFAAGMSAAPAVILGNSLSTALGYALLFSMTTFGALMVSRLLPRKIPYALRIILYTLTAAAVYIPCYLAAEKFSPVSPASLGVFLTLIVTGDFVVRGSELRFFRMKGGRFVTDVISHILGFDMALILLGAVRELFSQGGIGGVLYGVNTVIPILSAPCGGFILIGLMGALIRVTKNN
ncbi:MAG: hypothetical protein K2N72_06145 [Oscillospiraceae bacterium]|nr:hypothetical protein [Oscillospiraceae bacterium]